MEMSCPIRTVDAPRAHQPCCDRFNFPVNLSFMNSFGSAVAVKGELATVQAVLPLPYDFAHGVRKPIRMNSVEDRQSYGNLAFSRLPARLEINYISHAGEFFKRHRPSFRTLNQN